MRIGIFTFHRATNYGAFLQTYGLVSYLKSNGYEVQVVDYKPNGMGCLFISLHVNGFIRKCRRLAFNLYKLPELPFKIKKRKMFWNFMENNLPLTRKVENIDDLPIFDAFIVGSDQVWSTKFTGGVDDFYWGQFDRKGAYLLSYAASAAEDMINSFYSTNNVNLLKTFDAISVREDELKDFLSMNLPQKTIEKVLDPTLLAGRSAFDVLIKKEKTIKEQYILIYQVILEKDKEIQEYAAERASDMNCVIYEIRQSRLYITRNGSKIRRKRLVTPSEFITLFKHARYIITTSFHGTAFSLLYNRPFDVVSVSKDVDSRAAEILRQLNLLNRLIMLPTNSSREEINWDRINDDLDKLRIGSRQFLKNHCV